MAFTAYRRDSRWSTIYHFLFYLRRISFIFTIFAFSNFYAIQIIILFITNLLMTVYIGVVKPLKGLNKHRIELMNEYQFSVICYSIVVSTDFVNVAD
jgi:hypothetical protein